jgi:transcriptional regulator NrdR family protein
MMTDKQKQEYVNSPDHCPYCNSEDITVSDYDFEGSQVWSKVSCLNCKKEWKDIYTLTTIE